MTRDAAWLDTTSAQAGGGLAVEPKGALGAFDVVPGRFVARESGVHRYGLSGSPGEVVQAKVATDAFEPVIVIVAPSGARSDLSGEAQAPDAGSPSRGQASDLVLAEAGEYLLFVSSRENITAGRAVTDAEYRLTFLCDAPRKAAPAVPVSPPSSRSGRFGAWESEPR